jgi:magnesium transporter
MLDTERQQALLEQIDDYLDRRENDLLKERLLHADFHDIAWALNRLSADKARVFRLMPPEQQAEVMIRLNRKTRRTILTQMETRKIAAFMKYNDEDDATDILQMLPEDLSAEILETVKAVDRSKIEQLFSFDPETAGGLMDLNYIIVRPSFTLKDVAYKVQQHINREQRAPLVFAVDEQGHLAGYIPYRLLIGGDPAQPVARLFRKLPVVTTDYDQEELLDTARSSDSDVIGVVDDTGRVLGAVHARDLLAIAESEATEDVYRFAGVHEDEDLTDPASLKVKRRVFWLIINLGTASLAAFVVSVFNESIAQMAMLAVFMPIVAGLGGNAGTQALAVTVRGLAVGELPWSEARRAIVREGLAGAVNGIITGVLAAGLALVFGAPPTLALVLTVAMIGNLLIAGLVGVTVPIILKRLGADPAVASSVFVTATTDVTGFLVFLGLGSWLLL